MEKAREALATMIWEKYKVYKKGREVVRSGFGLCGAYGNDYTEGIRRPASAFETILEHQAATTFLAVAILKLFPDILPKSAHQNLIELMAIHDVVEVDSGDLADDGHLDKSQKAADEKRFMSEFAGGLESSLLMDFTALEQVNGLPVESPSPHQLFGQLAFMIDKMEAILQLAIFELNYLRPNLTYKLAHFGSITERDQFYMNLTNSDACLDVWMAHFYDFAKSYKEFWLPKTIVDIAYHETRGKYPEWSDKILADPLVRCWPADRD